MPRLVSLSRAAKLVGISRGEMQKKVHDLELESFEGQVKLSDIERIFPDAQIEDNHIIEDLEKIVEQALKRAHGSKLASLLAPDPITLAARLNSITKEHALSKSINLNLIKLIEQIQSQISTLANNNSESTTASLTDLNLWINDSMTKLSPAIIPKTALLEKDTLLRVIAAQVHVKNTGHEFFIEGNNSILEAGLSAGLALNYGCSNGNCGKCKAKLITGEIKKIKPHDFSFSETEKLQNYFLACSNTAITDIDIEADEAGSEVDIPEQHISAKVKKIEKLSDQILLLNLKTPRTNRLRFIAGQSAILNIGSLAAVELPIASCPCDDMNIQFHIPASNDAFSHYVYNELKSSDSIDIIGPTGSFIIDEDSNKPVIFIAFDSGFAPIKSLIEHVVTLEHAEFISLYWLHEGEKPYMHNQCRAWEDALDNFKYHEKNNDTKNIQQLENNLQSLINAHEDMSNKNIFICGEKEMVDKSKEILLRHHAEEKRIRVQDL